jgi:hypothetical protein
MLPRGIDSGGIGESRVVLSPSLFRSPRSFRGRKIGKNFTLLGQAQKFAVFSHGLGAKQP